MTIHDIVNPKDCFTTMKRDGTFDFHNERGRNNPAWMNNPPGWGFLAQKNNPDGKVPVLNPEHYIHPLTGHYSSGCLDFSSP